MLKQSSFLFLFSILLISSCHVLPQPNGEGIEKEFTLSVGGEITDISYTPFTKAEDQDALFLFNAYVYDADKKDYSLYATGIFPSFEGVAIKLTTGNKYKICSSYVSMTDKWYHVQTNYWSGAGVSYAPQKELDLLEKEYKINLDYWATFPETERYYSETEIAVSDNTPSTISLNLKRCSAKLSLSSQNLLYGTVRAVINFEPENLMRDWKTQDRYSNGTRTTTVKITPDKKNAEVVFSFQDARLCWDNDNYEKEFVTDFYYISNGNETKFDSRPLKFKRNTTTNVEISMTNNNETAIGVYLDSDYKTGTTETINANLK